MTPKWLEQTGLVLFTENYQACERFYRDTIGLEVFADKGNLIVLVFGSGYLMVEDAGVAVPGGKSRAQSPVTLRFNVADVEAVAAQLREKGVPVEVASFDWGTIGTFLDPDGNRCELRNHFDGFFAPTKD